MNTGTKRINSYKRNTILSLLSDSKEHPSAEMIFNDVKPLIPEISLGTVYRNLMVLEENGDIVKVCTVDGKDRYDARTYHHSHFICSNCGRVLDLDLLDDSEHYFSDINSRYGYKTDSYKLEFHGLCDKCGH